MHYLPIFKKISSNSQILLIGGGTVAAAKFESLKPYGSSIRVKSLHITPSFEKTLIDSEVSFTIGAYAPDDLEGISIVIAATNDRQVNQQIKRQANQKGILVNCVDDKALCDFIFPALVRRGPLQIAISSAGISPVLARLIKRSIEQIFPENFSKIMDFLKDKRQTVIDKLTDLQPRRLFWENFLSSSAKENILEGNDQKAESLFTDMLDNTNNQSKAALYLIGAGCGDPDLMTLKGIQLLSRADIILYDRLLSPSLLERFARKDAIKIEVGKKRGDHTFKQADIHLLLEQYLKEGKIVARLKGGDPSIFAHCSEEIDIAKKCKADWKIIPGITAALGCAAYSGFPLTERGTVKSVRFMTLYEKDIYEENIWKSLGSTSGETLVFYMSIHHRDLLCQKLIQYGMDKTTPIMAVEQGTTPEHRDYRATLETFPETYKDTDFISPTLFIIGQTVRHNETQKWIDEKKEDKKSYFHHEKYITSVEP